MKKAKLLGLVFLFLGVLMITNVVSLARLATVIYYGSGPSLNYPSPSGSISAPTPLASGGSYTINVFLTDLNDPSTSLTCNVQVSYVSGGILPNVIPVLTLSSTTDSLGNYAGHTYTWMSPSVSGTVLKFHFTATNTAGLSTTMDTYGSVGDPTGDFYINGQAVSASSVIKVTSPTLAFKISLTSLQSYVTAVKITVVQGSTTLAELKSFTISGNDYTASYVLPSAGSYTITATIYTAAKPSGLTLSVLGVDWNASSSFLLGNLGILNTVSSLALLAVGSVLVIRKGKGKK